MFAKPALARYNSSMEQKNLNFSHNQTLENYIESMLEMELKTPPPFNYQEEATEKAFISILTSLCGGTNSFASNKREKLIYHVNAFYEKLTHDQWGKFHYDMCIAPNERLDTFNLDIIDKYESTFKPDVWRKYILTNHGLAFEEIKGVGYGGYVERNKGVYYRDTTNFSNLKSEEQERLDELFKARFLEIVVDKFSSFHLKHKCSVISFFIKKTSSTNRLKYISSEEITALIKSMQPMINFEKYNTAYDYSHKEYYEHQANKSLMKELYDEIFTSPILSLAQKNEILYDTLKIEKNHFYTDYNRIYQIIREGDLDENAQMLNSITFPLKTSYNTLPSEKELILGICDVSRLQVGRGIKIAAWFLDICEKDFAKGKFLFEKFLPFIKEEMLLDKKTNAQDNIEFLLAYANKKGKNSVTIKNKIIVVQQAMAQLEKEQLTKTLQLELNFDTPVEAPPVKKFKV